MKCIDPNIKKWLSSYQMGLLAQDQEIEVEAHLLKCQACFQEIYHLRPVFELFEEMPDMFLEDLQPRETLLKKIKKILVKQFEHLKSGSTLISTTSVNWWKKPWIKVLVPATVAVLLAIFFLPWGPGQYSDLAIIEKASYQSILTRDLIELNDTQKLFEDAMKLYEQENYAKALTKLKVYLEREPNYATGHFYLGVCLLLEDKIDQGIQHLKLAAELSLERDDKDLLEKCFWYLGNGYLKINDKENAITELTKIIELRGKLETEARELILKIEKVNDEQKK